MSNDPATTASMVRASGAGGAGIPVFRDPGHRVKMKLTECRELDGGCILANYAIV